MSSPVPINSAVRAGVTWAVVSADLHRGVLTVHGIRYCVDQAEAERLAEDDDGGNLSAQQIWIEDHRG